MKYTNVLVYIALVCIILLPAGYAIDISPMKANLNNVQFNKDYTFFLTLINNENVEQGVEMGLAYSSKYLEPYVRFEPKFFKIEPQKSKNVKITLRLDETIPVGKHLLETQPIADGRELIDPFVLDFTIPGAQSHELDLENFEVVGTSTKKSMYLNLTIDNDGNTIERISPKVLIRKEGNVVDISEYNTEYTLLPGTRENILLLYDPSKLNEGEYDFELEIAYNSQSITQRKTVTLTEESDSAITTGDLRSTNYSVGLFALFLLVLFGSVAYFFGPKAYYTYKKHVLERRIRKLTARHKHLEHTFKHLMGDVMKFATEANKVLGKYGDRYELK